jgi:hypothetical protein
MKKFICAISFILMTASSIAQNINLSFSELIQLSKMNVNEFENWALKNEMSFLETKDWGHFKTMTFKKNNNDCSITMQLSKNGSPLEAITYGTNDGNTYLKLKNECTNFGFKFIESRNSLFVENIVYHIFRSNTQELSLNAFPNGGFTIGLGPIDFERALLLKNGNLNR